MSINALLSALDERTIAKEISIPHDEARMNFPLKSNTVRDFDEFNNIIGDYYKYHYSTCVARGGSLSSLEARSGAKEILEREYRRRNNGNINSAYNDAHDGTNGGLRAILDVIADGLKAVSVERYIRDVFDRFVRPTEWDEKVNIIRQFIAHCGTHLSSSIKAGQPERYASDYEEVIRSYINALQQTSSIFRRL